MSFRTILPAIPRSGEAATGEREDPLKDAPTSSGRGRKAVQACDNCRKSKIKCDGRWPKCSHCVAKKWTCGYMGGQGQTRMAASRARLENLEQLVTTLRTSPLDEADRLLQRLRSSDGPIQAASPRSDTLASRQGTSQEPDSSPRPVDAGAPTPLAVSSESSPGTHRPLAGPFGANQEPGVASAGREPGQAAVNHPRPGAGQQSTPSWPPNPAPFSLPDASLTEQAIESFLSCSCDMFQVFTRTQLREHFGAVYDNPEGSGENANAHISCLMAVAAVGAQYMPDRFGQQDAAGFYDLSRHHFEALVERQPLHALKVCTLLAQYNVLGKVTISLAYVEIGLGMSRMYGLTNKALQPPSMAHSDWIGLRKTWRTLIFFSSWLSTSLEYISGNDLMSERVAPSDIDVENAGDISDLVQAEMTKICILKADILRMHLTVNDLSAPAMERITRDLGDWYEELPQEMHLESSGREDLAVETKQSIMHVHLLYLGAVMLLYRRIATNFIQSRATGASAAILQPPLQGLVLAQAGEIALTANSSARILKLLLEDNSIYKRCWLVIFQTYTTCTILLHVAVQKQLHNFEPSAWKGDLECAKDCLSVLSFCGSRDRVAAKFHAQLSAIYREASPQEPESDPSDRSPESGYLGPSTTDPTGDRWLPYPADQGYLLHIPTQANTSRVNLALSLLLMLSQPFGVYSDRISTEAHTKEKWLEDPPHHEYPHIIARLGWDSEKLLPLPWGLGKLGISSSGESGTVSSIDAPAIASSGLLGNTDPSDFAPSLMEIDGLE